MSPSCGSHPTRAGSISLMTIRSGRSRLQRCGNSCGLHSSVPSHQRKRSKAKSNRSRMSLFPLYRPSNLTRPHQAGLAATGRIDCFCRPCRAATIMKRWNRDGEAGFGRFEEAAVGRCGWRILSPAIHSGIKKCARGQRLDRTGSILEPATREQCQARSRIINKIEREAR